MMAEIKNSLFPFIHYVNATWYFNLAHKGTIVYFPSYASLPDTVKRTIVPDHTFDSEDAIQLDLAYQAFRNGIMEADAQPYVPNNPISLTDNYRFLRKYFHPSWALLTLFLRVFTLHSLLKEWGAYRDSRNMDRTSDPMPDKSQFARFDSIPLSATQPAKVAVIIPTLNRYSLLKDVLLDLEKQDHNNFEVIIVDQSQPYDPNFYNSFKLNIKLIRQEQPGLWSARNRAILQSDAPYLLFFDDDSRVEPDWISNHLKCLHYFNCDISAGVSLSVIGGKIPSHYAYFRWSDQLDTGNVMLHRKVFSTTGLFDTTFEGQRMGDGEFGLRCYLAGFKSTNNPRAFRIHLKHERGGLREIGSWSGAKPSSLFAARPIPSVLYFFRKYFGWKAALWYILVAVPPSYFPYRSKRKKGIFLLVLIILPIILPLACYTVLKSWVKSGSMLRRPNPLRFVS